MRLPVYEPGALQPRCLADVQSVAMAVQANLVQLRVEADRRKVQPLAIAIAEVPAPGAVCRHRDVLIDRHAIKACSNLELLFQLHEVWGQFCAIHWLLSKTEVDNKDESYDGQSIGVDELQCETAVRVKLAEVHAFTWRFRFELDRRRSQFGVSVKDAPQNKSIADKIPASAFGRSVGELNESELALAACEYLGMMRVLRWTLGQGSDWHDLLLTEIDDDPFCESRPS